MKVPFYKYQATGNDFVLLDNREGRYSLSGDQIGKICDRRFGVGADGVILIESDTNLDFGIRYYNGDGTQSLCGNGCRAAIDLASNLGIINGSTKFAAYDGPHEAQLLENGQIRLRMNDVTEIRKVDDGFFINTGSPHFVRFVECVKDYPVFETGRVLRYSNLFKPAGANANFAELQPDNTVSVRTYERGVEEETFSCGTGVTAVALTASLKGYTSPVSIRVLGGELSVEFKSSQSGTFHDIFLIGPAKLVFQGELEL